MLPIVWLPSAERNLANIVRFIAQHNPAAARKMDARIRASVLPASEHPYIAPVGRIPGTHEIVAHPNYIVVYRVAAAAIQVLRVLHARQQYPD
ncbi:type II toxin-antitoxin system RelE/ParE family toxin [Paraburkholderia guartelaensis]|uniref:Type II toxin-antitoxin system RelE/ParE family toxin n=1 Tax=Paraburkholderia guartelaensis TaxID=2546446 RepID=A0A4R5L0D2_9BURK|nr:type II toxin-antitoxin system RelE/ParE family toxin [Paraburkholderia guartelaensis]TDG01890.1 type II toxin-antitoxin system RelE/ParE family toxin [Paraburkholderia guartelaensis]